MSIVKRGLLNWVVVLAVAATSSGCIAAAAAAGAGGAVYATSRGAESLVEGQPAGLLPRVTSALAAYQVQQTGSSNENGGDRQEVKGTKGDLEVTVSLERKSPTSTQVVVTARKNLAEWDKDFARQILQRIVTGS